jgi:hypothetical protein
MHIILKYTLILKENKLKKIFHINGKKLKRSRTSICISDKIDCKKRDKDVSSSREHDKSMSPSIHLFISLFLTVFLYKSISDTGD